MTVDHVDYTGVLTLPPTFSLFKYVIFPGTVIEDPQLPLLTPDNGARVFFRSLLEMFYQSTNLFSCPPCLPCRRDVTGDSSMVSKANKKNIPCLEKCLSSFTWRVSAEVWTVNKSISDKRPVLVIRTVSYQSRGAREIPIPNSNIPYHYASGPLQQHHQFGF